MREQLKETIKIINKKIAREYPEVFREINNPQIEKQLENEKKSRWIKLSSDQKNDLINYAIALKENKNTVQNLIKIINLDTDISCIPSALLERKLNEIRA